MSRNIVELKCHAVGVTSLTHGAVDPTNPVGFNIFPDSDRYLVVMRNMGADIGKTKVWFMYDLDSNISTADRTALGFTDEECIVACQGALLADLPVDATHKWIADSLTDTGAKGLYIEVVQGTLDILVADNHNKIDRN